MALKIKFVQIDSDVYMRVLEQGDEITRGDGTFFVASNGVALKTDVRPELHTSILYVRGEHASLDNDSCVSRRATPEEARATIEMYVQAIREYNRSLVATDDSNNDVFVVIAE